MGLSFNLAIKQNPENKKDNRYNFGKNTWKNLHRALISILITAELSTFKLPSKNPSKEEHS